MKIGIVTFWQTRDNYGQMLQCWALQTALKQLGHEPYLVRYAHTEHTFPLREKITHFMRNLLKLNFSHLIIKQKKMGVISDCESKRDFESFKNKHLKMTKKTYYSLSELRKDCPEADCYIVGSDQVWSRGIFSDDGRVFMLDFVQEGKKKLSYAASFGSADKPQPYIEKLNSYLKSYIAVSVRERSGLSICSQAGIQASLVADPTLLLTSDVYNSGFSLKNQKKNQVFIYSLNIKDSEEIGWSKLKAFAETQHLDVVVTPASGYFDGNELYGNDVEYRYCNIPGWIETINESKFVVTTSFHGVMFCILFHTPFVYVPLQGKYSRGNNRVLDFINFLGVEVPCYSENFDYSNLYETVWNWDEIDFKLNDFRKESLEFLVNALK